MADDLQSLNGAGIEVTPFDNRSNADKALACAKDAMAWAHGAVKNMTPAASALLGNAPPPAAAVEYSRALSAGAQVLATLAMYYQRQAENDMEMANWNVEEEDE